MPVRGARETSRALRELAKVVSVPINATSRFALQPTLKAAKANVRALPLKERTGTLAASLVIKPKPRSSKLNPTFQVGPDASAKRGTQYGKRSPVRYAHLLEFGTAPHYQPKRGVVHPGARPYPFLTPAYFATRDEVVNRFGKKIGPEMEKRAAKLLAKAAK
ncbi:MAG: HK97 gp10 family phage protein [Mesorhizobium sp.]|nr:MAG: HK97 gp10 family phage protein [Mesorhizobium sp.]RWN73189.1 MAG: HK97 gp10 family phage protein [Mesorhizobium sp.]RWN85157.1 MAG: HK97 gp10 family phage protein [Mesorhizobium sp.]